MKSPFDDLKRGFFDFIKNICYNIYRENKERYDCYDKLYKIARPATDQW